MMPESVNHLSGWSGNADSAGCNISMMSTSDDKLSYLIYPAGIASLWSSCSQTGQCDPIPPCAWIGTGNNLLFIT